MTQPSIEEVEGESFARDTALGTPEASQSGVSKETGETIDSARVIPEPLGASETLPEELESSLPLPANSGGSSSEVSVDAPDESGAARSRDDWSRSRYPSRSTHSLDLGHDESDNELLDYYASEFETSAREFTSWSSFRASQGNDSRAVLHFISARLPISFEHNEALTPSGRGTQKPLSLSAFFFDSSFHSLEAAPETASSRYSTNTEAGAIMIKSPLLCFSYKRLTGRTLWHDIMFSPFKEYLFYSEMIAEHIQVLKSHTASPRDVPAVQQSLTDHNRARYRVPMKQAELAEWSFFYEFMEKQIAGIRAHHEQCLRPPPGEGMKIRFQDLWNLYRCGMQVIVRQNDGLCSMLVAQVTGGQQALTADAKYAKRGLNTSQDDARAGSHQGALKVTIQGDNHGSIFVTQNSELNTVTDAVPQDQGDLSSMISTSKFTTMTPLTLDCLYLWWNGRRFAHAWARIVIPEFEGETVISNLQCFPVALSSEYASTLQCRGEKYIRLCQKDSTVHKLYSGNFLGAGQEYYDGPIIIDHQKAKEPGLCRQKQVDLAPWVPNTEYDTFPLKDPDMREYQIPLHSSSGGYWQAGDYTIDYAIAMTELSRPNSQVATFYRQISKANQELDIRSKQLLPPSMFAFALKERRWACVYVDHVKEMTHAQPGVRGEPGVGNVSSENAILENLVLPPEHKGTLVSLVRHHVQEAERARIGDQGLVQGMDAVRGKGEGLIVLLYGPPGTGKTSTAEGVAALTHRPLFPISCNDLGPTPAQVEEALLKHFRVAAGWDCILLLDEADIFLSQRENHSDINRDAMVGAFLKVLEYYRGILFLTTNKVEAFDPAVFSRLRIALKYPKLSLADGVRVFEKHISGLQDRTKARSKHPRSPDDVYLDVRKKSILRFAQSNCLRTEEGGSALSAWNGRDIKNAFQVAVAMVTDRAIMEKQDTAELRGSDFKKVAKLTTARVSYVNEKFGLRDDVNVEEQIAFVNDDSGVATDANEHGRREILSGEKVDRVLLALQRIEERLSRPARDVSEGPNRRAQSASETCSDDET